MKTQLKIRTEYSFRNVYGPVEAVADRLKLLGCETAAITDRSSTFGHVHWAKACKRVGIKPIFGVELAFIEDVAVKERRQNLQWHTLLARSPAGLRELYATVEEATSHFHYVPRLPISKLVDSSKEMVVLYGASNRATIPGPNSNGFLQLNPAINDQGTVAVSDNFMIEPSNRAAYEILAGRNAMMRPAPIHILDEWDLHLRAPISTMIFRFGSR